MVDYSVCKESEDGEHALDLTTVSGVMTHSDESEADPYIVIDVFCLYCGQSQGYIIRESDITWQA